MASETLQCGWTCSQARKEGDRSCSAQLLSWGWFWVCQGLPWGAAPGALGSSGQPLGNTLCASEALVPSHCGPGLAPGHGADAPSAAAPTTILSHSLTLVHSVNICLRTYCVSRHQETVSGASILLGVPKKSTARQVKSHGRDVIRSDSGTIAAGDTWHSLCARCGPKCFLCMNPSYRTSVL